MGTPRVSYARSADGVSLAFTVAGAGPALVFVPWVPFSNLRMEGQNPLLSRVFEQLADPPAPRAEHPHRRTARRQPVPQDRRPWTGRRHCLRPAQRPGLARLGFLRT